MAHRLEKDVNWLPKSEQAVWFSVDGISIDVIDFRTLKEARDAAKLLDGNHLVRVYYYADETDDPYDQAYRARCWAFRVDILMEQEENG